MMTIVYPEDFDVNKIPPGAVTSICEEIIDFSGFSSAKTAKIILEQKREKASRSEHSYIYFGE